MTKDTIIKNNRFANRCRHSKFLVDESLNTVECGICHAELNPIWVLLQLCGNENLATLRLKQLEALAVKAQLKNRCKCQHCKKMTRIQK